MGKVGADSDADQRSYAKETARRDDLKRKIAAFCATRAHIVFPRQLLRQHTGLNQFLFQLLTQETRYTRSRALVRGPGQRQKQRQQWKGERNQPVLRLESNGQKRS